MIRQSYGIWGELAAIAFVLVGVWVIIRLPGLIEEWRWSRIR